MLVGAGALGCDHQISRAQKLVIALLFSSLYQLAEVKLVLVQLPLLDLEELPT